MSRDIYIHARRGWVLLLLLLLPVSCIQPMSVPCESGRYCPSGFGCATDQDVCISVGGCGDGLVNPALEVCDDGNIVDGDGCSADCRSDETCGNNIVDLAVREVCDDGNHVDGDGCSANCRSSETCGNRIVDPNEECDDGNQSNEDNCLTMCVFARCGDGFVDGQGAQVESCDPRLDAVACNQDCTPSECGDGKVNPSAGEECDDGNQSNGDNCLSSCRVARCGDGHVDALGPATEECDPGSDPSCDLDCTRSVCGDGYVNVHAGEQCDGPSSGVCDSDCSLAVCGDGFVNPNAGEQCDTKGDSVFCDADCTPSVCGDNYVNRKTGEDCDTGGNSAGCNANCSKSLCGDGFANPVAGEQCDDGNLSNGDNCLNSCQRARCGDGYLDKSEPNIEQCDDGNAEACGTCSSACTQKVTPAKPEGRIVAIEGRKIADGEKFYVSDGSRRVEFEFDKNGAQPLPLHRVAISDSYDASGVASQIRTAIKGAFPDFDVTSSGFVVDVIHAKATAVGNQPIEETVADATFIVYGMSGGATNDCLQGVGCKQDADCASGACTNGICE